MSNQVKFLEYDSQTQEQNLVKIFEEQTGKKLYPAQDERLLISLIEYKASLLVNQFNEAAKQNLTQYSKGIILDCIGEMFDTPRLQGEYGYDTLTITLNTTFTTDLTIDKGLEVLSKDEKHTFATVEDVTIPAGETCATVKIQSRELTDDVNKYGAGDITILVKPISYILSVTNNNGVQGGAGVETDEAYAKRILLAPEKFSCAGSRQSYIYHALSANTKIIDASAESVCQPATLVIKDNNENMTETITEENNKLTSDDITINVNKAQGEFDFTIDDKTYTVTLPYDTTVNVYPLTEDETTPNEVIEDVQNLLNGEQINPMTDRVVAISPTKINKTINLTIQISEEGDTTALTEKIYQIIEEYKTTMRRKLASEIIPSQIIAKIGSLDGVYSVNTGDLTKQTANKNEYFDISFNTVIL